MVIALLVSLAGTTLTGMKLYAVEENKGPFAITASQARMQMQSVSLITEAKAEDDESKVLFIDQKVDKQDEEFWEELHELFANLTLLLVFLHVGGVIASSIIDKEKLVKAMLTGEKNVDDTYQ